jgi:hypothetical protein
MINTHRETDHIVLSTGRRVYANNGILGLNEDLSLHHGYDGYVVEDSENDRDVVEQLTTCERMEISRYMVRLWTSWAALKKER